MRRINPLFAVLENLEQQGGPLRIGANTASRQESREGDFYFLISLAPVRETFFAGGEEYRVIENHFTIFQNPPSAKVGNNSASHYRVTLASEDGQRFKIYLYLDDQGRVTVTPELLPFASAAAGASTPLSRAEQDELLASALDPARAVLNRLLSLCREQREALLAEDRECEAKMVAIDALSSAEALARYTALVEQRIHCLSLVCRYSHREDYSVLNFLLRLQQRLTREAPLVGVAQMPEVSDEPVTPVSVQDVQAMKKFLTGAKKKKKKGAAATASVAAGAELVDDQAAFQAMLDFIKKTLPELAGVLPDEKRDALLKKLGSLFFDTGLIFYHASRNPESCKAFEVLRFRFIAAANRYCQDMNDEQLSVFFPVLQQAHLLAHISLPQSFLLWIIEHDRVDLLRTCMQEKVYEIFEQATYAREDGDADTLLELMLKHNAINCYECLVVEFKFSPFYLSKPDSAVATMFDNLQQVALFSRVCTRRGFDSKALTSPAGVAALYDRRIVMCESPEQCEFLQAQKQLALLTLEYNAKCNRSGQGRLYASSQLSIVDCFAQFSVSLKSLPKPTLAQIRKMHACMEVMLALLDYVKPLELVKLQGSKAVYSLVESGFDFDGIELSAASLQQAVVLNVGLVGVHTDLLKLMLQQFEFGFVASVTPQGQLQFKVKSSGQPLKAYERLQTKILERRDECFQKFIVSIIDSEPALLEQKRALEVALFADAAVRVSEITQSMADRLAGVSAGLEHLQRAMQRAETEGDGVPTLSELIHTHTLMSGARVRRLEGADLARGGHLSSELDPEEDGVAAGDSPAP